LLRSLPFQGPKSLDFQGPTLTIALVMDFARLKIIMSRAIKTTGTLIVIICSLVPEIIRDRIWWPKYENLPVTAFPRKDNRMFSRD
jgi:hypothetical protein